VTLVTKKYAETLETVLANLKLYSPGDSTWTDADVAKFVQLTPKMCSLETLMLKKCGISEEGMKMIVDAPLKTLKSLSMSECPVGDAGIVAFCTALDAGAMPCLETIFMRHIDINDETRATWKAACTKRGINLYA